MGWFQTKPSTVSAVSEIESREKPYKSPLLEDLPPKFEDDQPPTRPRSTLMDAISQISLQDISFEHYVSMPCFRESMLTGFQAMGVLWFVTFVIHKNPSKSVHWNIGGFFLGSAVGWEQCRSIRRRSFETVEAARRAKEIKNRERLATDNK